MSFAHIRMRARLHGRHQRKLPSPCRGSFLATRIGIFRPPPWTCRRQTGYRDTLSAIGAKTTTAKARMTLRLRYHPRTRALIDGEIAIDGYELEITHDPSAGERHYRFAQGEWDIGEYSAATFLRTREKGFRFLALPIFFERGPRQRNIYYFEGKLNHPSELKGKKIGCFRYGATAVVWARGFLLDEYGLKTTDMNWYVSGREVYIGRELPVKVERLDPPQPFGHEKPHLAKLLSEGDIHAALVAGDSGYPGLFGGGALPKAIVECPGAKPLVDDAAEMILKVPERRIDRIIYLTPMNEA